MSLTLNFDVNTELNCTQLVFTEETGVYDDPSNLGGWESPNDSLSSVSSWVISITTPSSDIPIVFDEPVGLPSSTNGTHTFSPSDLGYSDGKIQDGVYIIEYDVETTIGPTITTYKKVLKFYIYCNVSCCVHKMALKIKPGCCCDDKYIKEFNLAEAMLISLSENARFDNETQFNNFLIKLQLLCSWNNCGCS